MEEIKDRQWWKEAVIYQIYPRSFKDSNGDGIGDLPGIIEKLDYLKDLGVNIIWLSPIYKSPNDDNGYDISDYYDIMDEFGTMADFDRLLKEMEKRDLKLMMDLVVNHSSDEHAWFVESRKSRDNPYRDHYIWKQGKNGAPPNNWVSFFGGSAWEYDPGTDEYYLHFFTRKQPDLNWEKEEVREEIYKMMRFWLDKGVKGYRMDVIPLISKDQDFPGFGDDWDGNYVAMYANGPRIHEFLKEMNREVMSKYDIATVGEGIGITKEMANHYVGEDSKELNMIFHFDNMFIDRAPDNFYSVVDWDLVDMKRVFTEWDEAVSNQGWNSLYLGNHDFPRMLSRFGDDGEYWLESGKLLATMLFTLRGTPYIYNGDELGMTNMPFHGIEEYRDVSALNAYKEAKSSGKDLKAMMQTLATTSRDHARTPMQWDESENAGFTAGSPWIRVNPNYREINARKAQGDPNSLYHYYRQLILLRKSHPVFVYGRYQVFDFEDHWIYAYTRMLGKEKVFVVLNFSKEPKSYKLPNEVKLKPVERWIGNYEDEPKFDGETLALRPYEGGAFEIF